MQLHLFSELPYLSGAQLRDIGMGKAEMTANAIEPSWSDIAYSFLLKFASENEEWMLEEVRAASVGIVPLPPSLRAWGAIVVRAAQNNIIQRIGFRNVSNPKAHATPASIWRAKRKSENLPVGGETFPLGGTD